MGHLAHHLTAAFHPHEQGAVIASLLVAVFASYVSLEFAERIRTASGRVRVAWLAAASVAIGGGIWSMHFIAMLGLKMPFAVGYGFGLTALSLITAIVVCASGLYLVFWHDRMPLRIFAGGLVMGLGVAAMHYMGMAAMVMPVAHAYDPALVALSLVIAVAAATAALWLSIFTESHWVRLVSAPVMAAAIAGMHFTGMAAFSPEMAHTAMDAPAMTTPGLVASVTIAASLILLAGLGVVYYDQYIQRLTQVALARFGIFAASSDDFAAVLLKGARTIATLLDVESVRIFDIDLRGSTATVTWLRPGTDEPATIAVESHLLPILTSIIRGKNAIHWRRGMMDDAITLLADDRTIRSGLVLPVAVNDGACILVTGFSAQARSFTPECEDLLRTQGRVLAVLKERQIALEDLRFHHKAMETISQGITVTNQRSDGATILYANPAFARMTGYDRAEVVGMPAGAFLSAALNPEDLAQVRRDRASGVVQRKEFEIVRKDGSTFIDRLVASPLFDAKGRLAFHVTVHEDVTEERHREQQLREMQRMESVSHLTGGIAHEFNNLLAVIVANAEILEDDLEDLPSGTRQISMIKKAADRGAGLVRQLLTFAHKKTGRMVTVDVRTALEDLVNLLRRTLEADIAVTLDVEASLPPVKVDEGLFKMALLNIALNARDAMPSGGSLAISAATRHKPAFSPTDHEVRRVQIVLKDSGCGMTKDVADRAFVPFFTTKEIGKGTGLGLSVVHGFAQQSGGSVQLESAPGRGTTVRLDLPAGEAEPVAMAANDDVVKMPRRGSILLVEDDPLVRATMVQALERLGYRVRSADSAPAALQILEQGPLQAFDLVFSDVVMPEGMNGAELAREVQKRWPGTKVLLTSGYAVDSMQGRLTLPEGVDLLGKPYSNADLMRAIDKACA